MKNFNLLLLITSLAANFTSFSADGSGDSIDPTTIDFGSPAAHSHRDLGHAEPESLAVQLNYFRGHLASRLPSLSDRLIAAVQANDPVAIERLSRMGADVNIWANHVGNTGPVIHSPLLLAIELGHDAAVAQLLACGADTETRTGSCRQTALMYAIDYQRESIVRQLIVAGAKLEAKDVFGVTAFYQATKAYNEHRTDQLLNCIVQLHAAGAEIQRNKYSCFALMAANKFPEHRVHPRTKAAHHAWLETEEGKFETRMTDTVRSYYKQKGEEWYEQALERAQMAEAEVESCSLRDSRL